MRAIKFLYQITGIGLGLITLLLWLSLLFSPFLSNFYSNTIYPVVFQFFSWLNQSIYFSLISVFLLVVLTPIIYYLTMLIKAKKKKYIRYLFNLLGLVYCVFYFLWGFNYASPKKYDEKKVESFQLTEQLLLEEINRVSTKLDSLQWYLPADHIFQISLKKDISNDFLAFMGVSTPVKCVSNGWINYFQASGIYFPFTGQPTVYNKLLWFDDAFTQAHELSHALGYTEEAYCNYLAYKFCIQSTDSKLVYAGYFNYLQYLLFELKLINKDGFLILYDSLSPDLKSTLENAKNYNKELFSSPFKKISKVVYSYYLKSNNIQEGERNYNKFVLLVLAEKE